MKCNQVQLRTTEEHQLRTTNHEYKSSELENNQLANATNLATFFVYKHLVIKYT